MWRTFGKKSKKNTAYRGAWLGLGMDYTCSTRELAPEIPSCPVPLQLAQLEGCSASLAGVFPTWILCSLCQDRVWTAWPGGFTLCWDTGDTSDMNSIRAGGSWSFVCPTNRGGGNARGKEEIQAGLERILVALPGPLSLTPLRSSQARPLSPPRAAGSAQSWA